MWTIEPTDIHVSRKTVAELQDANLPIGNASLLHLTFTMRHGEETISFSTFVESEAVAVHTMRTHLERLNAQEDFIARVSGGFVLPEPVIEQPAMPTQDELAERTRQEHRAKLLQMREDVELGIATPAEFEALKSELVSKRATASIGRN